ncbi:MAG: hypothetical protein AAFS03_00975 [Pseudomonadota bacterium]
MFDLRLETQALWRSMSRMTTSRATPSVMFISPERGLGTSSVAASVAMLASAKASKPVWLVDLDLRTNPVFGAFEDGAFGGTAEPGRVFDASLNAPQIFDVDPPIANRGKTPKLITAVQVGAGNLLVTRFRSGQLAPNQRVRLTSSPGWWTALRRSADWIIVDAPALSRSSAGLVVAEEMDGVVIVAEADRTTSKAVSDLRDEIEDHGGRVLGVVMNRIRSDARFVERLLG